MDNADVVFAECFDLNAFVALLDRNSNALHDRDLIHNFMKASVIDSKVSTNAWLNSYVLHMSEIPCRLSLSQAFRSDI